MKKITFILFLFAYSFANAQSFTLSGKVVDKNQEILAGASVLVKELNQGTSTDFNGNYKLPLTSGNYTIQVTYLGYKMVSKQIAISKNETLNFQMSPNENVLDEVFVSAVRVNAETPVTFSNVSKEDIAQRNLGQDIPILLNYLPSVVSSSDAGAGVGYTSLNVRGSNAQRINVTINGIPYNDAESQGTFWVNLGDFASSTENLQLQRGVGTSTNGSGAFGASLNILTDAISQEAYGQISNSFGSFNTRKHTVKFSTGKLNDHIEIAGRLSNIYSDGYVDRAFTDLKSYFLQASYVDENTLIKAITFGGKEQTYQSWFGLTADQVEEDRRQNPYTYDNETDNYQQDHYQLLWNETLNENWSTNLALNYTKGQGFFEQYENDTDEISLYNGLILPTDIRIDEDENGVPVDVPITDLIRRRWLDNDYYVANFNATYKTEKLNLISGISYANYTGDHFGEVIWAREFSSNANIRDRYYFSDAKKTDFSVFAKANFDIIENVSGYVDLQGRFVGYQTEGLTSDRDPIDVNANFSFFNPKVGLTYTINELNSLYASFAVANKEPNRNDFENGVTKAENLNDFEIGWRLNTEQIKLNTNIYYMNYKNQLVLTGAVDDVGAPIRATSGSSYRLGLEVDADITFNDHFSWKPNVALSTNKNRDFFLSNGDGIAPTALGDTNLSYSPNIIAGSMFSYKPVQNLEIAFLSKFVGEQYLNNIDDSNSILKSYFVNDLNLVYQIKPNRIFDSIILTGLVNNVFNVEYISNAIDYGGGYIYYYPQAGINFLAGITLNF